MNSALKSSAAWKRLLDQATGPKFAPAARSKPPRKNATKF